MPANGAVGRRPRRMPAVRTMPGNDACDGFVYASATECCFTSKRGCPQERPHPHRRPPLQS
eukprot:2677589-Alexandrium_andersonii.AAC.1